MRTLKKWNVPTELVSQSMRAGEDNDCTVIALSVAFDQPYTIVHKTLARCGRKRGRGFAINNWLRDKGGKSVWGFRIASYTFFTRWTMGADGRVRPTSRPTLTQFVKSHPTGRFVLTNRNHCFVVIDGVIHDNCRPKSRTRICTYSEVKDERYGTPWSE